MKAFPITRTCVGFLIAGGLVATAFGQAAHRGPTGGDFAATNHVASALATASGSVHLSATQQAEAQARMTLAKSALARLEANAQTQKLGTGWKTDAMNMLLAMPSGQLKALSQDGSWNDFGGLRSAAKAVRAKDERPNAKLLGDQNTDLVYYPITPCRNVDTRNAGGPIAGGTARQFNADIAAAQGGTAGCGIVASTDASAWAMNITVVNMNA